jgi:hypothetical protein
MGEKGDAYKVLVEKTETKRTLGKPTHILWRIILKWTLERWYLRGIRLQKLVGSCKNSNESTKRDLLASHEVLQQSQQDGQSY